MASPGPLVSCIIPTKNRPQFIRRAINSALGQTYPHMEVIVVDDSTDERTRELVSHLGSNVRYIKNEKSRGASYSRNVGLLESKGDVIAFLDDDDVWLPQKIASQLPCIKQHPLVGCNFILINNNYKRYVKFPPIVTFEDLLSFNHLGSCSFVIADAGAARGCFFDEGLKVGLDWDMWLSIMKKNNLVEAINVDKYLVEYNDGGHSRITDNQRKEEALKLYRKYYTEYNPTTATLFALYHHNGILESTLFNRLLRKLTISQLKGKGISFLLSNAIKRIFCRVEYY